MCHWDVPRHSPIIVTPNGYRYLCLSSCRVACNFSAGSFTTCFLLVCGAPRCCTISLQAMEPGSWWMATVCTLLQTLYTSQKRLHCNNLAGFMRRVSGTGKIFRLCFEGMHALYMSMQVEYLLFHNFRLLTVSLLGSHTILVFVVIPCFWSLDSSSSCFPFPFAHIFLSVARFSANFFLSGFSSIHAVQTPLYPQP